MFQTIKPVSSSDNENLIKHETQFSTMISSFKEKKVIYTSMALREKELTTYLKLAKLKLTALHRNSWH